MCINTAFAKKPMWKSAKLKTMIGLAKKKIHPVPAKCLFMRDVAKWLAMQGNDFPIFNPTSKALVGFRSMSSLSKNWYINKRLKEWQHFHSQSFPRNRSIFSKQLLRWPLSKTTITNSLYELKCAPPCNMPVCNILKTVRFTPMQQDEVVYPLDNVCSILSSDTALLAIDF